jgi:hypothetical protein
VDAKEIESVLAMVGKVMASSHRLYARHARKAIHAGDVSDPFAFGAKDHQDRVVELALAALERIEMQSSPHLAQDVVDQIFETVPGLLPALRQWS